jgi:hypothetical protein
MASLRTAGVLVAVATLAATAVQAADLARARAFVVRLYAHYPMPERSPFDPLGKSAPAVFDPSMVGLLRTAAAQTPKGDEGPVDWDPICSCQDDTDMKSEIVSLKATGPSDATAVVRVKFHSEQTQLELALSAASGAWRIHDIKSSDTPSLRAYLIQPNRGTAPKRK